MHVGCTLDYRHRLWTPTSASRAISAVAEFFCYFVACSRRRRGKDKTVLSRPRRWCEQGIRHTHIQHEKMLTIKIINPLTTDPVKALHFAILV